MSPTRCSLRTSCPQPFPAGIRRGPSSRAASHAWLLGLCLLSNELSPGQDLAGQGVFLPSGAEYEALWRGVEEAARSKAWETVLEGLTRHAQLLRQPSVSSVVQSGGGMALSIHSLIGGVVDQLPSEVLERYRKRLDPIVEQAWEEALVVGGEYRHGLRRRILREYSRASLWRTALEEEIDSAVEAAEWSTARELCGEWLVHYPSIGTGTVTPTAGATEGRPPAARDALRARLVYLVACQLEGDAACVAEQLRILEESRRRGDIDLSDAVLRSALDLLLSRPKIEARPSASRESYLLGDPVWSSQVPDPRFAEFAAERGRTSSQSIVPIPFEPVSRDGLMLFQHLGKLIAYDTRLRKEAWSIKVEPEPTFGELRAPLIGAGSCYYTSGSVIRAVSRLDGSPRWSRSLQYDRDSKRIRLVDPEGQPPIPAEASGPTYSLSPPVLLEGNLAVGVGIRLEQEQLFYMACLGDDGRTRWTTFLGSSQTANYLGLAGSGSPPLVSGRRIYYLTNMGFVAALDAVDGAILWLGEYPRLSARGRREAIRNENRWQPNPVVSVAGQVVVAPQDAACLFALDGRTGELLWQCSRQGGSILLGADEQACFVVGGGAFAVSHSGAGRGRILWQADSLAPSSLPADEARGSLLVQGRGLISSGVLFLSLRDQLLRVSSKTGEILSRTLWEFGNDGGNLVLEGAFLGVSSPGGVVVYGQRDGGVVARAEKSQDPGAARLTKAKAHLRNFELDEALRELEAWAEGAPVAPAPNSALDQLCLDVSETISRLSRIAAADNNLSRLLRLRSRLEHLPRRRVKAAVDLADHLERRGDVSAASQVLYEALSYDNPDTEYVLRPLLTVGTQAYLRNRIRLLRLRTQDPSTHFAEIDGKAAKLLQTARVKGVVPGYLEVLRFYPFSPAAREAYLELARLYRKAEGGDRVIDALEGFVLDFPDDFEVSSAKQELSVLRREDERGNFHFPARMVWRSPADLQAFGRTLLTCSGVAPPGLGDCFLTQSLEIIECREIETGIPRWRTHLELIPGFEAGDSALGIRFPRRGRSLLTGSYVGSVLVLSDDRNIFALDPLKGTVRWHVPVGSEPAPDATGRSVMRHLRERLRGVTVSEAGVFATSSGRIGRERSLLRRFNLEGEQVWELELDYEPALYPPIVFGHGVFVPAQRPLGIFSHDASTGRGEGTLMEGDEPLEHAPLAVAGSQMLLLTSRKLRLLDLPSRSVRWTFEQPRATFQGVSYFPESPDECILTLNRSNNWPAIVCIALGDGVELWRYEQFPARRSSFSIFRKDSEVYVVRGESGWDRDGQWELLGLRITPSAHPHKPAVTPLWPKPVSLGILSGGSTQNQLHITGDSIILAEPTGSITVLDRALGARKSALETPMARFLAEKGNYTSALLEDRLILLTDSGDCAFEPVQRPRSLGADLTMQVLQEYLDRPGDARKALALAAQYFRDGGLDSAVGLLDDTLLNQEALTRAPAVERRVLNFLLDGIKEERMKVTVPTIISRRVSAAPDIDGSLNEPWDMGSRIQMASPLHIGKIPSGDQRPEWEGTEDLSAVLYTGWDSKNFYLALDVTDDVLYPYDRDAETWKGDCLIIGLDPTGDGGYRQAGDDQLMTLALSIPRRKVADKAKKGETGGDKEDEDEPKPEGLFSVKKKDDDSGAIYEIALPWSSFSGGFGDGDVPAKGYSFGLSLLLTDDDTGQGATKTLSINPCHLLPRSQKSSWVWRFIIPDFFPRVVLE